MKNINIGVQKQTKAFIYFINGLVDNEKLNQNVIKALLIDAHTTVHDEKILSQSIFVTELPAN